MPHVVITVSTFVTVSAVVARSPRHRVDAAVRERRGHHGKVAARRPGPNTGGGTDRARPPGRRAATVEADAADGRWRGCGGRAASRMRRPLSSTPGRGRRGGRYAASSSLSARLAVALGHQAGRRDGARVDHRVERLAGGRVERDRVERVARRLDADSLLDRFRAQLVEDQRVRERLRDRLDRELLTRVADLVNGTVDRDEADRELSLGRPWPARGCTSRRRHRRCRGVARASLEVGDYRVISHRTTDCRASIPRTEMIY